MKKKYLTPKMKVFEIVIPHLLEASPIQAEAQDYGWGDTEG